MDEQISGGCRDAHRDEGLKVFCSWHVISPYVCLMMSTMESVRVRVLTLEYAGPNINTIMRQPRDV